MAFNPLKHAFDEQGRPTPKLNSFLDNTLRVQRPLVLRWVKKLRREHPDETPEQIARRLERAYVRASTVGGGAVGGAAIVPGIGTAASLGLSTLTVGGYLELTALYTQAIAELHGISTEDPERARSMVMALMLGEDGEALMGQVLASGTQARGLSNRMNLLTGKGQEQKGFDVSRTLRNMFIKRFLRKQSTAFLGRAMPFGIGAVVGGGANWKMARSVVENTREAFGQLPPSFPPELAEVDRAPRTTARRSGDQKEALEGRDSKRSGGRKA